MTHLEFSVSSFLDLTSSIRFPVELNQPIKVELAINEKDFVAEISQRLRRGLADSLIINIGIDEVGRGPLYGSVVIAGAVLPYHWSGEIENSPLVDTPLAVLTDSKKLTEKKREALFEPIQQLALAYITVEVPAATIDQINILQATLLGMRIVSETLMQQLMEVLNKHLTQQDIVLKQRLQFNLLIDGNKLPMLDWEQLAQHGLYDISVDSLSRVAHSPSSSYRSKVVATDNKPQAHVDAQAWIKGDARHTAIAAASVLAKVKRDRQVAKDGAAYPGYGLEQHKGYPTKAHLEAIKKLGVLPSHRRSFSPVKKALTELKDS